MSIFNVELKKVVDDTYDIEIGYNLSDTLVSDLENGLAGKIKKFAVITDTNVPMSIAMKIPLLNTALRSVIRKKMMESFGG